jgi:hypothetical protein
MEENGRNWVGQYQSPLVDRGRLMPGKAGGIFQAERAFTVGIYGKDLWQI